MPQWLDNYTRVNDSQIAQHHYFGGRGGPKQSGMLAMRVDEDVRLIDKAEFTAEVWGGHPGTSNKRVSLNGRSTYYFDRNGS